MRPIKVAIHVCPELAKVTGWRENWSINNEGCLFFFFFECLLIDYPEIMRRYSPEGGLLGFVINGVPPELDYRLKDGDCVEFRICREGNCH